MKKTLVVAILIVAMILGIVAYAFADVASVQVTARVSPKLTMTVNTTAIDLGGPVDADTGTLSGAGPQCNVRSNKAYDFATTWPVNPGGAFSDNYADASGALRTGGSGVNYNGTINFNANFGLAEGANTGTLQFEAVQVP
jgi:hypothetical protein